MLLHALACSTTGGAFAQDYPVKPVRLIVPIAPGGTNDILARALAQALAANFQQSVIVDNRPGGGGITGTEVAARAAADGYTLLMVNLSHAVTPAFRVKLPYDVLKDFSAVGLIGSTPNVLVVHPSLPANSLAALIALAKGTPGKLNYASAGNGSSPHLAAELFKMKAGVDIVHIPYQGTGPALNALLGSEVSLSFATLPPARSLVSARRLGALAITSPRRSPLLPSVPTFGEAGLPGYEFTAWFGLVAPAGTPPAIVRKLNGQIQEIVNGTDFKSRHAGQGIDLTPTTPEQFVRYLQDETSKWRGVVAAAGIDEQRN
ncbi:MAG: tripartite tricarboxylate transporter substrate binding protein [Burkholderiales bacterium]